MKDDLRRKQKAAFLLKVSDSEAVRCSGRRTENHYRTEFMRDRDRILNSKAFRRLAGKAQVYISGVDDHKRTRLTHTLEVSQIARTAADALRLDTDLVEAIALGHDLGHTPFGHAGERTLHEIMTPQSAHILGPRCPLNAPADPDAYGEFQGFKHNLQSLTVAMQLERNYEGLGIDLTNYTLYGIQAHSSGRYKPGRVSNHDHLGYYRAFQEKGCKTADGADAWSLESLLVAEADEIAQYHHDMEDALLGGLITPTEIVRIITECFAEFKPFQKLTAREKQMLSHPENYDMGEFVSLLSRILVNMMVTRLTAAAAYHINAMASEHSLNNNNFRRFRRAHSPDDELFGMVFSYSYTPKERSDENGFARRLKKFQGTITQRVLSSYDIQKADAKGKYIIQKLFQAYYTTPTQLPDHCVYELFSTYHGLDKEKYQDQVHDREKFWMHSEQALRDQARLRGVGSVRQLFSDLFADRSQTRDIEEILLMRVICNHIAGMTDTYAQKTYAELYG